jgi:hypothetical protein
MYFSRMKINLHSFLLILLFSQFAVSASYTAVILNISDDSSLAEVSIQMNDEVKMMTLQISSEPDRKLFRRLKSGDYLAFQGQRVARENTLKLLSLDYIGLKSVLGIWIGDDGLCYNFSRFTQLTVFAQSFNGGCVAPASLDISLPKTFKYFITPNENNWDILVGDQDVYFTAEFQLISPNNIAAQIFDTETGKIVSELILWR